MRLPRLTEFRLRILLRGVFLLLALATIALALHVLQQEKQLSYKNYRHNFIKTQDQIAATLRHPAGQLALLNPPAAEPQHAPLRALLLPFSALDFDDQAKVRQAVAMSGCLVQYGSKGSLCAGVGSNPWAGGFIYVAGSFNGGELVPHQRGDLDLDGAHRVRVGLTLRGQKYQWIAPFEQIGEADAGGIRGRLTGFIDGGGQRADLRPVKEFRGWVWQDAHCIESQQEAGAGCERNAFFSMRLPVSVLQEAILQARNKRPVWPPPDLRQVRLRVEVLAPGAAPALLDSDADGAVAPFSVNDLKPLLLPGESLRIRRVGAGSEPALASLTGADPQRDDSWRVLDQVIRRLPVDEFDKPLAARSEIATPVGNYEMLLDGDVRSVNKSLAAVATRVAWFVGAMLLAIVLAWLVVEVGIIRRITQLTRRAASVSQTVKGSGGLGHVDLSDMRGADELGVLASCLHDLLRRVREDLEREEIRAEQEKEMWHAVGHEIMSPLQSLMALHGSSDSPSSRYLNRMQQAVRVLYGSASPSEAFQSTVLQVQPVDVNAFLANVAGNAPCVGIEDVRYEAAAAPVWVRADDYSLEDVVTHVLRNADRYRAPGSPITIRLDASETAATVTIRNQGPCIPEELIGKVFEYGVSDQADSGANGNRGQGLFVAKTYMAKMGGTIAAHNLADGVALVLTLQRAAAPG